MERKIHSEGGNTMEITAISDREKIKNFLLEEPYLHLYELGNLHEKIFSRSKWFCASENGAIKSAAMLHISENDNDNILFLLENKNTEAAVRLLQGIISNLPDCFYAHVSHDTAAMLNTVYETSSPVIYNKMKITGDILLARSIKYPEFTYRVNKNDFEAINEFLRGINPEAFFTSAMIETGKYFIIRKNSDLIAMAGVHFYSKELKIAAIGNVATAPEYRGKGYAGSVAATLCRDLWKDIKYIGLNVRADNIPAIKAYEKMGFVYYSSHEEIRAKRIK